MKVRKVVSRKLFFVKQTGPKSLVNSREKGKGGTCVFFLKQNDGKVVIFNKGLISH
jgi:hypothetical protein